MTVTPLRRSLLDWPAGVTARNLRDVPTDDGGVVRVALDHARPGCPAALLGRRLPLIPGLVAGIAVLPCGRCFPIPGGVEG